MNTPHPSIMTTTKALGSMVVNDYHQISRVQKHSVPSSWHMESSITPMLNQEQLEDWTNRLDVFQMPEMVFDSRLTFRNEKWSNFELSFHAYEALENAMIDVVREHGGKHLSKSLKVGHAWDQEKKQRDIDEWNRKHTQNSNSGRKGDASNDEQEAANTAKQQREDRIDWTFTSIYRGTLKADCDSVVVEPTEELKIDYERLKRRDPIRFYDEVVLFEDELHDCGHCTVSVKTRVMDDYFFILLRCFLRVDKVILRMIDTRFYHEFDKDYIIREDSLRQESFESICRRHPIVADDPRYITDVNWLANVLPILEMKNLKISVKEQQKQEQQQQQEEEEAQQTG